MGKLEELTRAAGAHVDESMGGTDSPRITPGTSGAPARWQGVVKAKDVALIPLDRIARDEAQPREEFEPEALARLAESLRTRGQLQPVRVRWDEGRGVYLIVAGERRWRAAAIAGLPTLSCVIDDRVQSPEELLAVQLVENALREDLRPIEQAKAFRRLIDAHGWSTRRLAQELSVSQPAVIKALALLDLPEAVQEQVEQGGLSASAAYEVARLPRESREEVAAVAVTEGMSREEVAELAKAVKARRPAPPRRPDRVVLEVEGATVTIRRRPGDDPPGIVQILRRALKRAQEQERLDERGETAPGLVA